VAPALRSFLTTLEWPLEDATVSAVSPSCDKVEGCFIMQCISLCSVYWATSCTEVITKQQLVRISDLTGTLSGDSTHLVNVVMAYADDMNQILNTYMHCH